MTKRINVTLPEETVELMDRVTKKGDRSRLINRAVTRYVSDIGRENLREALKQEAIAHAAEDLALAEEWFPTDADEWPDR